MSFSTNRFSRKALLLVTAVFSASLLWAQATGISGRVLDETGAPVIGATVMVKGTTIATATNVDGTFNLKNTGRNSWYRMSATRRNRWRRRVPGR